MQVFVEFRVDRVDERVELTVVEEVDRLRRQVNLLREARRQPVGGDEIAEQRDQVVRQHDHAADQCRPVAPEAPPDHRPLRGGETGFVFGQPLNVVAQRARVVALRQFAVEVAEFAGLFFECFGFRNHE